MKKLLVVLIVALFTSTLFGQTVLLEEDVAGDTIPETFGPNLKRYRHLYFEYGFLADKPEGDGLEMLYGHSHNFGIGLRYKYRMTNFLALGWDIHITEWTYRIKQTDHKVFPNDIKHKREKLTVNNFGLEFYTRLNFGKRGNHIGNFIDLAAFGNYIIGASHYTLDVLDTVNINNAGRVHTTNKDLIYLENINYGFKLRFGINRYVISASYRFSDLIKDNFVDLPEDVVLYPELPRLFIAFQIGIH
jgi:hypothetical protein